MFKVENASAKQVISWVVAIALSILGLVGGLGLFASYGAMTEPMSWVYTIITGFGIGLSSNGLYDINVIKQMLEFVSLFKANVNNDKTAS